MAIQLHVSSTYEFSAVRGRKADGSLVDLVNLALAVTDGDAVTIETDDTPSDNKANVTTIETLGALASVVGSADGSDGSKFAVVEQEIELVAEDVPLGTFELEVVELI